MRARTPSTITQQPHSKGRGWLSALRFLIVLALAAWALRSFVVAPFSIPSGSMMPAMLPGDYLFVAKWPYGWSRFSFPGQLPAFAGRVAARLPERGDIVIFKRPGPDDGDWVKRVIGLPGDEVGLRRGAVILNNKPLLRRQTGVSKIPADANIDCAIDAGETCRYRAAVETLPNGRSYVTLTQQGGGSGENFGPVTVPAGHLFLLGDHRDNSADSRFGLAQGGIGMVPVERLVGRAAFAFWSTDGSADYRRPWTWLGALRAERLGKGYQP